MTGTNTLAPRHDEVFLATVTERPDGRTTCTVSLLPTTERRLRAAWVRSDEFVALDEAR